MMREAIPDIPPDRLLKAISPAARSVSANTAPEVHAILADLQGKVKSQGEISKIKAQLKTAKVSERPLLYRKLGESSAVIGDWKQALENLSKGDGEVVKVAQYEMGNEKSVCKRAGMWWDASEEKGIKPAVASAYRKHAAELYKRGLEDGSITGLNKTLAEQRIEGARALTSVSVEQPKGKYCVVDLSSGPASKQYRVSWMNALPSVNKDDAYKTSKLVLLRIDPGKFEYQPNKYITITKPFYIGVFEVTQSQYELVCGNNPSEHRGATRPVDRVSYSDLRGDRLGNEWPFSDKVDEHTFVGKIRQRTGLAFDLPTQAQWELACRANVKTAVVPVPKDILQQGKFAENDGPKSHHNPVGSFRPNRFGLYDTFGNVWEWCLDKHSGKCGGFYSYGDGEIDAIIDPKGPVSGSARVYRGISFYDSISKAIPNTISVWAPNGKHGNIGFRLCLNIMPW